MIQRKGEQESHCSVTSLREAGSFLKDERNTTLGLCGLGGIVMPHVQRNKCKEGICWPLFFFL